MEADRAEVRRLAHAPGAVDIAGEVIGRKPEGRGIGDGDRVRFVVEAEDRRDGPEGFFLREAHRGVDTGEAERCSETFWCLGAGGDFGALAERILDMLAELDRKDPRLNSSH